MGKISIITIVVSILIITGSITTKYYEGIRGGELEKISIEKESYSSIENPYYLNNEILKGNDANKSVISFMNNKSNYYSAQRELDNNNYDEALIYLDNINLESFNTLKYDLMGDIYFYKGDGNNAKINYKKALETVSINNDFLKESIFSKYQSSFQK